MSVIALVTFVEYRPGH